MTTLLTHQQLQLTIQRLAHQLIENDSDYSNLAIIGLQPRGVAFSNAIVEVLKTILPITKIDYGVLDITFYRDDIRTELHQPNKTEIPFSIEKKRVILIDDVLYTGRTIRAALDALQDFGRPKCIELCVLIDRRYSRELPIQPTYAGKAIDAFVTQKVKVNWAINANEVVLLN